MASKPLLPPVQNALAFCGALALRSVRKARNATSTFALNEGKGEQARAEQREAGKRQRQKATGNDVPIGHEISSIALHRVALP